MERRKDERWRRRLNVRFWNKGEDRPRPGHTLNVSSHGMYVGTNRPPKKGARVRIEVLDPQRGFVVEGVVTHSRRMPPELQHVKPSGMGIRFLRHDELLALFVPVRTEVEREGAAAEGGLPPLTAGDGKAAPGRPGAGAAGAGPRTPPPAAGQEVSRPGGTVRPPLHGLNLAPNGVVPVHFRNREDLDRVFRRDMRHGGLFIPTCKPAELDQIISLQIHLAGSENHLVIPARVVHLQPEGGADAPPPGMGVQFLDPENAVARLRQLAES